MSILLVCYPHSVLVGFMHHKVGKHRISGGSFQLGTVCDSVFHDVAEGDWFFGTVLNGGKLCTEVVSFSLLPYFVTKLCF